jgi:aminoglycoside/choline kinase family phosphotransferase
MDVSDASDSRLADLTQWVVDELGFAGGLIAPASVDASFRRYFRVTRDADTYIVMDAPPDKEDMGPFVRVAKILAGADLNVPLVLARDLERGFLLLSDLGAAQGGRCGPSLRRCAQESANDANGRCRGFARSAPL